MIYTELAMLFVLVLIWRRLVAIERRLTSTFIAELLASNLKEEV